MVAFAKPHRKVHTPDRSAKDSGHRFYNPEISRWLSRDPMLSVPNLLLYVFLNNSPISSFDTLGLYTKKTCENLLTKLEADETLSNVAKFKKQWPESCKTEAEWPKAECHGPEDPVCRCVIGIGGAEDINPPYGYWDSDNKIVVLCHWQIKSFPVFAETVVEEYIHAFDNLCLGFDYTEIDDRMCTEIRAAMHSGKCASPIKKSCIETEAVPAVKASGGYTEEQCKEAFDENYAKCFAMPSPF